MKRPDPIQIARLEKKLKRKLTDDERCGFASIQIQIDKVRKRVRIYQLNLEVLNITNYALLKEEEN